LGLALSEKQIPQVVEKIEKPKEQIEGVESSAVLRRQTLHPQSVGPIGPKPKRGFLSEQLCASVLETMV